MIILENIGLVISCDPCHIRGRRTLIRLATPADRSGALHICNSCVDEFDEAGLIERSGADVR